MGVKHLASRPFTAALVDSASPRSAQSEILRISSCPANWRLSVFAEFAALVTQACRRGAAGRAGRRRGTPRR